MRALAGRVDAVEGVAAEDEDVAEHGAGEAHGDDVDELGEVAEPRRLRQRAEQRHPHVRPEEHEAHVLQRVHARVADRGLVQRGRGARGRGRSPTAGTRPAGGRGCAGGRRTRIRSTGASTGPVRPRTSSSAPRSAISRCSAMCAANSSSLRLPVIVSVATMTDEAAVEARLADPGDRARRAAQGVHAQRVEHAGDRGGEQLQRREDDVHRRAQRTRRPPIRARQSRLPRPYSSRIPRCSSRLVRAR